MNRMNLAIPLALVSATLALVVPPASTSRALPGGGSATFPGRYVLAMPYDDAVRRIEGAIDAVAAEMNPLVRPIARGRLRATNRAYREITVGDHRGQISVQYDDARYITRQDEWRTVDARGEQVRLLSQLQGSHLYQTFVGHDGRKLMVLTVDSHSLWLDVTAEGPNLPSAVRYRLPYRRL